MRLLQQLAIPSSNNSSNVPEQQINNWQERVRLLQQANIKETGNTNHVQQISITTSAYKTNSKPSIQALRQNRLAQQQQANPTSRASNFLSRRIKTQVQSITSEQQLLQDSVTLSDESNESELNKEQAAQDQIAESLSTMANELKRQAKTINDALQDDMNVLKKGTTMTANNLKNLETQDTTLAKHNSSVRWNICAKLSMLTMVLIAFFAYMFIIVVFRKKI